MIKLEDNFLEFALYYELMPTKKYSRAKLYDTFMNDYAGHYRFLSKQKFNGWLYDYGLIRFGGSPDITRNSLGTHIEFIDYKSNSFQTYVNKVHFIKAIKFDGTPEVELKIRDFISKDYDWLINSILPGQYIVEKDGKYSIWEEKDFNNNYTLNNDRR